MILSHLESILDGLLAKVTPFHNILAYEAISFRLFSHFYAELKKNYSLVGRWVWVDASFRSPRKLSPDTKSYK